MVQDYEFSGAGNTKGIGRSKIKPHEGIRAVAGQIKSNHNFYVLCLVMFFILQSCWTKEHLSNKYINFPYRDEIQINDSCVYLIQNYGHFNQNSIISLNPNSNIFFNAKLIQLDSYAENGIPLRINKSYSFHLEMDSLPNIKSLQPPNEKLLETYFKSDSLLPYGDYTFYLPKEDKIYWINIYDGITNTEKKALLWIEKNITKISIEENVNYLMLVNRKQSYFHLKPEKLKRWYIIPQKELTGIPTYFKKFEGNYFSNE